MTAQNQDESMIKCCFYFTEDDSVYKRLLEEEDEDFLEDSDDANEGEGSDDNGCEDEATSASSKIEQEEIDPEKLEEELKKLAEVFRLPKVLIKRTLFADDVKGDMKIACQRLQEFKDMENPQNQVKAPMKPKSPAAETTPGSGGDFQMPTGGLNAEKRPLGGDLAGMGMGGAEAERQSFRQEEKGRQRRKKNNIHESELQGELNEDQEQPESRKKYFERNEEQMDGNQVYRHEDSRGRGGFRGRPRGGSGPRGAQSQRDKEEYRDEGFQENWHFGSQGDDYTIRPQGGRGNWNGGRNPPKIKPKPRRGPRGVSRGGWPAGGDDFNIRYQANRERPGSGGNRGRGRGGMTRAQSLSSLVVYQRLERRENEEDESRFDQNKLIVRGLSASTTHEGVLNLIEAKSGEKVKEVTMLGKGKAVVTMAEQITSKYLRSTK